jgi:hypothetical protein
MCIKLLMEEPGRGRMNPSCLRAGLGRRVPGQQRRKDGREAARVHAIDGAVSGHAVQRLEQQPQRVEIRRRQLYQQPRRDGGCVCRYAAGLDEVRQQPARKAGA